MNGQYINKVDLVGRVGQKPEIRYFESGAVKTTLTLAVKPPYKSEDPMWWNIELWGNLAEVAASYTDKGSLIGISGELKIEYWVDQKSGLPRSKPVIKAMELELLRSSNRQSESSTSSTVGNAEQDVANAKF